MVGKSIPRAPQDGKDPYKKSRPEPGKEKKVFQPPKPPRTYTQEELNKRLDNRTKKHKAELRSLKRTHIEDLKKQSEFIYTEHLPRMKHAIALHETSVTLICAFLIDKRKDLLGEFIKFVWDNCLEAEAIKIIDLLDRLWGKYLVDKLLDK